METQIFNGYSRLGSFPLDDKSIFSTYALAVTYAASNTTAYAGQLIAVVENQVVDIYTLRFPIDGETGTFILQSIRMDSDTLSEHITDIPMIGETPSYLQFDKIISVERIMGLVTAEITEPNDAVNLELLRTTQESIERGLTRTIVIPVELVGVNPAFPFVIGDIIKRVTVVIETAYDQPTNFTIIIGEQEIMSADDIFEQPSEEPSSYIIEPMTTINTNSTININLLPVGDAPTIGSAIIYVDVLYNIT